MTYLRKVVFTISYGKLTKECYSALKKFINTAFGFEITDEVIDNLSNRPLYFGTDDHTLEWRIDEKTIHILIRQEVYHSFEATLRPLVEITQTFLKETDRKADEISLHKINLIPVALSSYEELNDNVTQIFTESILSKWNGEVYQKSDDALVYLTKNRGLNGEDIEVITGFISKEGVSENQPARYILDLTARYKGEVSSDEVLDFVKSMNDQLYKMFIGAIVEGVIKSMEEV